MTLLKISSHLFEVRWIRVGPFQGCRFAPPLANIHAALRAAVLHAGGVPEISPECASDSEPLRVSLCEKRTPNGVQGPVPRSSEFLLEEQQGQCQDEKVAECVSRHWSNQGAAPFTQRSEHHGDRAQRWNRDPALRMKQRKDS